MKFFKLPDLGEGLQEAEIVEWHINAGEEVKTDQLIVSVETAKAIVEVPSPRCGKVITLCAAAGEMLHVGEPLIEFEEGEDTGTVVGKLETNHDTEQPTNDFIIGAADPTDLTDLPKASFRVRQLAKDKNVDLSQLEGSGVTGKITEEDVLKAALKSQAIEGAEALKGVRRTMAINMGKSHASVVPVTLFEDADIRRWAPGQDITVRLIQALVAACHEVPRLNAWYDDANTALKIHEVVDIGVAVDAGDGGLFVPVLRDCANRSGSSIREGLNHMRDDLKDRSVPTKEMLNYTITLSNFGTMAGRYATPIVVPPTVAIVGSGVIRDQAVPCQGKLEVHKIIPLSLTFDHRAATGGEASRFLKTMIDHLSQESL